jgi:2-polyprenyl-3-methyl-5-hydroxy-6-metoxy-1,4-benzoquinol methylase
MKLKTLITQLKIPIKSGTKIIEISNDYTKEFVLDPSRKKVDGARLLILEKHENGKACFEHFPHVFEKSKSILDIGCANGDLLVLLKQKFPNLETFVGIDIFPRHIEIAKQTLSDFLVDGTIVFADITNSETFSEITETFDVITFFHTLEHIFPEHVDTTIENIKKLLSKNGTLIVSLPYGFAHDPGTHTQTFDEISLCELFEQRGFKTVKCIKDTNSALTAAFTHK